MISQIPTPHGTTEEQLRQLFAALTRLRDDIYYELIRLENGEEKKDG